MSFSALTDLQELQIKIFHLEMLRQRLQRVYGIAKCPLQTRIVVKTFDAPGLHDGFEVADDRYRSVR